MLEAIYVMGVVLVLYLVAIMPRMFCKPDDSALRGWYYAHRGLHDNGSTAPENSLPAFRLAVENGYGIELDVQLTKDKKVVVFHDNTLKRVCGIDAKVNSFTYEELLQFPLFGTEERIPLFSQVLQVIGGKVPIIMEIKMVDSKTTVCRLADEVLQGYNGVYCMESFHPLAVYWYKRHRPEVIRGQLSAVFCREGEQTTFSMEIVQNLLTNFLAKPDFVAYSHKGAGNPARQICRYLYRNLSVAWTIRSEQELKEAEKKFDLFIFEGFRPDPNSASGRSL